MLELVAPRNLRLLRPPPKLTLSEWADQHRILSRGAAEAGPWRTARVPYMREVMDCFTDPLVERVVCKFASQLAKTEGAVLNPVGYFIDQDPAHILIVEPREFDAKKTSKKRLAPMIRDCPRLRGKVKDPRARDSENTILEKEFPGGSLTLAGANSPAGLAGDYIRVLLFNEVSRFPASAGAEGDPVEIAEARTTTFPNRKIGMNSSPTDEGVCRITKAFEDSDQRSYFVPCPKCGAMQTLRWAQVRWQRNGEGDHLPETARYYCDQCDAPWTEGERHEAVRSGEWVAAKEFVETAGFHLNALYAPWANLSLPKLAAKWLKARHRPMMLKAFINTVLGEVWKDRYETVHHDLGKRRERYPLREGRAVVPVGVIVMTAGVDVQDDRLECQVKGYGLEDERWALQYHVLDGDPSTSAPWLDLWELLCRPLEMERGGSDYIRATAVDTGHHTLRAYDFCRPRARVQTADGRLAYVFAIKGQGGTTGDVWVAQPNRANKGKIPLYTVRVDPAKEALYTSLQKRLEPGPGYLHFPLEVAAGKAFDQEYFDQLTSEVVVTRSDPRGFEKRVWELRAEGRRNEALDTSNYADAAFYGLARMGLDLEREAARIAVEAKLGPPPDASTQKSSTAAKRKGKRTRRRWEPANL